MSRIFLSLILIINTTTLFAATFAERVSIAKDIESQKEAVTYFKSSMYPAIGPHLGTAMKECTDLLNANLEKFAVVADVTQEGKFINIDYEPKTNTATCLAEAVANFRSPPPPSCECGDLPIVIEMTVTP